MVTEYLTQSRSVILSKQRINWLCTGNHPYQYITLPYLLKGIISTHTCWELHAYYNSFLPIYQNLLVFALLETRALLFVVVRHRLSVRNTIPTRISSVPFSLFSYSASHPSKWQAAGLSVPITPPSYSIIRIFLPSIFLPWRSPICLFYKDDHQHEMLTFYFSISFSFHYICFFLFSPVPSSPPPPPPVAVSFHFVFVLLL